MNDDALRSTIEEVLNPLFIKNPKPIKKRIKARYIGGEVDGHWILRRPVHNDINFFIRKTEVASTKNGRAQGRYVSLRRLIYLLYRGPIPIGRHLTNNCGLINCVAPKHLKLMSKDAIPEPVE